MERKITYKTLRTWRRFGIEIEMSKSLPKPKIVEAIQNCSNYKVHSFSYGKSVNNKLWHVKSDITCGNYDEDGGWEVASFVGRGPQDINHMGSVATALKEVGAEVNSNCGLHIHAEIADFSPEKVGILLAYWIKIENIIKSMLPLYRKLDYCIPISDMLESIIGDNYRHVNYNPLSLYKYLTPYKPDNKDEDYSPFDWRYQAINIVNYYLCVTDRRYKRKTIELRMPESTLNENDIVGWLRLYLNFIEFVKTAPMPKNLYESGLEEAMVYLGLHHDSDNFYIFGASLNKTRIWFLNKLISNKSFGNSAKILLKRIKI